KSPDGVIIEAVEQPPPAATGNTCSIQTTVSTVTIAGVVRPSTNTVTTYQKKPWGVEIISQSVSYYNADGTLNPDADITTYVFNENGPASKVYGKRKGRTNGDGAWQRYA